ncbi:MAG: class I SAM-dependent methyltransferase [Lachnospiraceae bacterium]|nr:class I SAM-dependent methyltransferase [Lachnospiraceae bacterium]
MYGKDFCRVYNEFGWNYYPEAFGEQLGIWLLGHPLPGKTALDIGCGTGVLCRILKEMGFKVTGIDLSEDMIDIARNAGSGIDFEVADMVTYRPEGSVDLVTCTGDALNHLSDISYVERMIGNVYGFISPGGYFVFDVLNGREGRSDEPFELERRGDVRVVLQITREGCVTTLHVSTYKENELLFEEKVVETFYEPDSIRELLRSAGFEDITCEDSLNPVSSGHGTTLFFTARHP